MPHEVRCDHCGNTHAIVTRPDVEGKFYCCTDCFTAALEADDAV